MCRDVNKDLSAKDQNQNKDTSHHCWQLAHGTRGYFLTLCALYIHVLFTTYFLVSQYANIMWMNWATSVYRDGVLPEDRSSRSVADCVVSRVERTRISERDGRTDGWCRWCDASAGDICCCCSGCQHRRISFVHDWMLLPGQCCYFDSLQLSDSAGHASRRYFDFALPSELLLKRYKNILPEKGIVINCYYRCESLSVLFCVKIRTVWLYINYN